MATIPTYIKSLQIHTFLLPFLLKCKQRFPSAHITPHKPCSKSFETMIHISKNKPRLFPFPFQKKNVYTHPYKYFAEFSNTYRYNWLFLSQGNTSPKIVKHDPQSQQGQVLLWITPLINSSVNYQKAVKGAQINNVHAPSFHKGFGTKKNPQNQPKFHT